MSDAQLRLAGMDRPAPTASALAKSTVPNSALPKSATAKINWIRLIRSRRVGPCTFLRLVQEYGSAEAALFALPDIARQAGVANYHPYSFAKAEAEYQAGRKISARLLCLGMADYPPLLGEIKDPPPLLWALGNLAVLKRPSVALVGARNASSLGNRMARLLAGGVAQLGASITSGLARGIDTAAHLASLERGTIAIMAGGVDVVYPTENAKLAKDLLVQGLRLSEHPIGLTPQARHFPRRNRIISGLSLGVVVVEGASRSGSLITANAALEQGREVMAVPGHPLDPRTFGCNMLIRDGAHLVRSAADIAEVLHLQNTELPATPPGVSSATPSANPNGPPQTKHRPRPIPPAADILKRILTLLSPSPIAEDQLIRELRLPPQTIAPHLLKLELDGKLNRQSGGMLALTP